MSQKDSLSRFLFDKLQIRGEFVHLDESWRAVLSKHDYPAVVRDVLGEAVAATVLLSATIKFLGSITLQIQGDGPVGMLVVQVNTDKQLRAMASYDEDQSLAEGLKNLFGEARLVISIEMGETGERYQGIVELSEGSVADALEEYFRSSEQLQTRLWLAANDEMAAGFLLQEMPKQEKHDDDDDAWQRSVMLAETLRQEELFTLNAQEILHRLYHEEDVRLFKSDQISFSCSCSRERIENTLKSLGEKEVREILTEQGNVGVDCNFCNQHYEFDAVDVERLFFSGYAMDMSDTRH